MGEVEVNLKAPARAIIQRKRKQHHTNKHIEHQDDREKETEGHHKMECPVILFKVVTNRVVDAALFQSWLAFNTLR